VSAGGEYLALAEHWNGHKWTIVASPDPAGATECELVGMTSISPTDAWAVGYWDSTNAVVEHWNGHKWRLGQHLS
jgi:hypothetical protein